MWQGQLSELPKHLMMAAMVTMTIMMTNNIH